MKWTEKRGALLAAVLAITWVWSSTAVAQDRVTAPATGAPPAPLSTRGLIDEPEPLRKGLQFGGRFLSDDEQTPPERKSGFYPELGNMVTGAGWVSAGVGYRQWLFGDHAVLDASTGLSWRGYQMAQARFEVLPFDDERVAFGTQVRWQDLKQINYWGEGPDSLAVNRSEYRLTSVDTVGYTVVRPQRWLELQGRIGWLSSPQLRAPAGAFSRGNPHTFDVFPNDPVYQVSGQPDYLHGEAAVVVETRDVPGYPTSGGVYRAGLARYADQDLERFSFTRVEAEAAQFVPLDRNRNFVLAVRGWVVGTRTAEDQHVPFYLMPSLGGSNTLRGYPDYRFHDHHLAVLNTELRVALMEHVDVVGLLEAGNVARRFTDLNLDKTSYGIGIRVHTRTETFARLDLARSDEGWQVVFRLNDPLRLSSRHAKRTAQAPFTP
jgi:hypothetical protein